MHSSDDMHALVVRGHAEHGIERIPRPSPAVGEALVAVTHAAVCSSDLRLLRGQLHDASYPVVPGHEWVGRVLEAPGAPEWVGHAVVVEGITPCRRCAACAAGLYNLCSDLDEVGFTRPGAFAEALTAPIMNLRRLPDGVAELDACLIEPTCVALHACERAGTLAGRSVGVLGGGAIGLLVAQLARASGAATITVFERSAPRRALANSLALETEASLPTPGSAITTLPEVVFDACGAAQMFAAGLEATRPGGTYVLVGYSGSELAPFAPSAIMLRELTVRGALSGFDKIDEAVRLLASGAIALRPLIGEPIEFDDASYRRLLDEPADLPLRPVFRMPAAA